MLPISKTKFEKKVEQKRFKTVEDPQCSLCCTSARLKSRHSKHGTAVVYEVEKSDSVGDGTVETTSAVRQGHRGHVNCV